MRWCKNCLGPAAQYENGSYACRQGCGRLLDTYNWSGATSEDAGDTDSGSTLMNGSREIRQIARSLSVSGDEDSTVDLALALYRAAVARDFIKGHRTMLVAAVCLYIACQRNKKPLILLDFSDILQINVYVLGAVFLLLCRLLRLERLPVLQRPVDPSVYFDRFTERLLGGKNYDVSRTAARILASSKRDYMRTGRRPSKLCGAALYVSAVSHGFRYCKSEAANIVRICEAAMEEPLLESRMTIREFHERAGDLDQEWIHKSNLGSKESGMTELLCKHYHRKHFANMLCQVCYDDFMEISRQQRKEKVPLVEKARELTSGNLSSECEFRHNQYEKKVQFIPLTPEVNESQSGHEVPTSEKLESNRDAIGVTTADESCLDQSHEHVGVVQNADGELDLLSDVNDSELDAYLQNEEGKKYRKIIWEAMNREYLEEQAVKETADGSFTSCFEDSYTTQLLDTGAKKPVPKSTKERKRKQVDKKRTSVSSSEASSRMLNQKTFSSKINYDELKRIFSRDQENGSGQLGKLNAVDAPKERHNGNMVDKTFDTEGLKDDYAVGDMIEENYYGEEEYDGDYNDENEYGYDEFY